MSVYIAGSFDPPTTAHIKVIDMAKEIFKGDNIIVVVAENDAKNRMFPVVQICKWFDSNGYSAIPLPSGYMLYKWIPDHSIVVRGIRDNTDLLYEQKLLEVNSCINPTIKTVFLMTPMAMSHVSSSLVRSLIKLNDGILHVSEYIPASLFPLVTDKHYEG